MKQQEIHFRELLERLLPVDELPPADRRTVQNALLSGVATQIEQAALLALRRLEQLGAVVRLPAPNGAGPAVRYEARAALHVFTLHLPEPYERDGVRFVPRTTLPARAPAGLEQVRQLMRLDDRTMRHDPRSSPTRDLLFEQLEATGRELLGDVRVRFVARPGAEPPAPEPALDPGLAAQALAQPETIIHCPDAALAPRLRDASARAGIGALVLVAVAGEDGVSGHLEATARNAGTFDDDALAMLALLADSCGAALDRASRLEHLVFVDPLTSVYNRPYFDLQLRNEMARAQREQHSLGLCLVDIDNFKDFNSRFGYEAGNTVLTMVAQTLSHGVRPFDTVSRWGGEEFALLLTPPVSAPDALTVSERLRGLVERLEVNVVGLDGRPYLLGVTVSIGVAIYPDHGSTGQDLWRSANQALLAAKRPPKNRVKFFDPADTGGGAGF